MGLQKYLFRIPGLSGWTPTLAGWSLYCAKASEKWKLNETQSVNISLNMNTHHLFRCEKNQYFSQFIFDFDCNVNLSYVQFEGLIVRT
jgi:phosphosulfolactate synthase (CoM biosynthesis protein A)